MDNFVNPTTGGNSWQNFLDNVVNATTRIIDSARNRTPAPGTIVPALPAGSPAAGASMTGLLVLAVLIVVVMKA